MGPLVVSIIPRTSTGFDGEDDFLQPNPNHQRGITGLGAVTGEESESDPSEDSNEGIDDDALETITDALGNTVIKS